MKKKAFFIASTGQHVGKTTICLGLLSGLMKRFSKIGFMKPVGQEHVKIDPSTMVDKDVVLFKDYFELEKPYQLMSPVIFSRGFTRNFLDGNINEKDLIHSIQNSFNEISHDYDWTVVEGTGHVGVGSIINLNNARIAHLLKTPIILIASGGLGSSFDALCLNKAMCDFYGVKVIGVILNRVYPEKRDMVIDYMQKALSRLNIPLLGTIPFDPFLSMPCMKDFESLFETKLLTGKAYRMRHFKHTRLVATSVETYKSLIIPSQLIITPANREDIILATLAKYWDHKINAPEMDLGSGMILTGSTPPRKEIIKGLEEAQIPMLYAPVSSFTAMQMITSHTAKIRREDEEKVKEAIYIVEKHIDFDLLENLI